MVAEGVLTTNAARALAEKQGIEMPITEQMFRILHDGKPPRDAIRELMTRPATEEGR
jgi:glycerol-3-phosphate dehydrogenase (NAD(P)+)